MNEEQFDSSKESYIEEETIKYHNKKVIWDMAIGLQKIDNLKPSKYLEELSKYNITGEKTIYEIETELKKYYTEKQKSNELNEEEFECDLVSTRIVELLEDNNFSLTINYIKYIHKFLFKDIYNFAGEFRTKNFSKHEFILNNDSVAYGNIKTLKESLEYDLTLERSKNYQEMTIPEVITNITEFSSKIWQVHPFKEGNTRTTALFIEKYLIHLGYNVDNTYIECYGRIC